MRVWEMIEFWIKIQTTSPIHEKVQLMQHVYIKSYIDVSLAYPVRLGILLGVPAELENRHQDRQRQAAEQYNEDTAWNDKTESSLF